MQTTWLDLRGPISKEREWREGKGGRKWGKGGEVEGKGITALHPFPTFCSH